MGPDRRRRPPRRRVAVRTGLASLPSGVGWKMLERKLAIGLVRAPFHLTAVRENGSGFRMRYRPATLRMALWQRLAGEVAGLLQRALCPAPRCGRWFLKGEASRNDRQFCSDICRVRAFRRNGKTLSAERHSRP
jgi:hypothetical protein